MPFHVGVDDLERGAQPLTRYRARHLCKRQMGGHQRDAHLFAPQEHDRERGASSRREIFRVAGKCIACVEQGAFLNGSRDHGGELAVHAAIAGTVQHANDVGGVAHVQMPRGHRMRGGHMQHFKEAGAVHARGLRGNVGFEDQRQAEQLCGRGEQFGVAGDNKICSPGRLRQRHTGVRPDSCRLPRGDDDPRLVHYILISTNASSRRRRSHNSVSSSALLSRMAAYAFCRRTSSVLS